MRIPVWLAAGLVLVCQAPIAWAQLPGTVTTTGNMTMDRTYHTATLLTNGKVLIAGGVRFIAGYPASASAELYDPANRTFTTTGDMTTPRCFHTATLLPDGKILIAGGFSNYIAYQGVFYAVLASAELYDPATGSFTATGGMVSPRARQTATLLNDGTVLVAGGSDGRLGLAGAELYDPIKGSFSATGDMAPGQFTSTATLLVSGKVLIAGGGQDPASAQYSAELYDPDTGAFSVLGTTTYPGEVPATANLLPNGKVLVTVMDEALACECAELYDSITGSFTRSAGQSSSRGYGSGNLLADGTLLITGEVARPFCLPSCNIAELYDPITDRFSDPIFTHRFAGYATTLLLDGTALLSGGFGAPGTAEIYHPPVSVPPPVLLTVSGGAQGAILHGATQQIVTPDNPAVAGEALEIYCAGLMDGSVIAPQVSIGGRAAAVLWFGNAPGFPHLNQVNVRVPGRLAPGPNVAVRMTYLARPANQVTLAVQ
jgi:hypothetical protein